MKTSSLKWVVYKITLLLTAAVFLLSACRPGPAIPIRTLPPKSQTPAETGPTPCRRPEI